ncbi:MAG: HD domain-containing protein [Bacteroidetes bacterium]|uniref:HD domain-containing protein n=1 Tax=Candidatus Cryptobacteroides avicola TaxID=2840757 RepID=A0A940IHA1_9BACT|nr:HD domain-containing protein [Candidatus Cryptobacteroides avicola]
MSTITEGFLDHKIFNIVSRTAEKLGVRAFVIGGYVRDCFLGRPCKDIDIVVEGSGIELAGAVGETVKSNVSVFKNFGTAMLRYRGMEVEFVGARKESYRRNSRKPIVEDGTLEDDQLRRDFTINAMAFSLQKEDFGALVDPFGGIRDLAAGIIRTPLDPDTTYSDDPLRMIRAIRFATKLTSGERVFRIVPESLESIRKNRDRLSILSRERITEELNKILVCEKPSIGFRLLDETGLLEYILPQLTCLKGVETVEGKGHKENFSHTLEVLDNVASYEAAMISEGKLFDYDYEDGTEVVRPRTGPNLWLRWAALLHDIAKPATKRYSPNTGWTFHGHEVVGARMIPKLFQQMKLPLNEKMKYVQKLVSLHLRPIALVTDEVTDSAVRRLLFDAGNDIDDLMLLCNADITSKNLKKVERLRKNFELVKQKLADVEAKDAIRNFKNPITGEYIMQLYGIPPCREIGIIKEYVKNAILDGVIENRFEEADRLMREKAAELGFTEKLS